MATKTAAKPAAAPTPKVATGFNKPVHPSKELAAIVGSHAMLRTEVVTKVWAYIKKHGLQDAADKRTIVADDKLKAVLGKERVTMFDLNKLLSAHLKA